MHKKLSKKQLAAIFAKSNQSSYQFSDVGLTPAEWGQRPRSVRNKNGKIIKIIRT